MALLYAGVLKILSGGVLVQLAQTVLFPLVAISYGSTSVSKLGALLSMVALISPVVNLRIDNLYLIADEKYLFRLLVLNFGLAIGFCILIQIAISVFVGEGYQYIGEYYIVFCVLVFLNYSQSISNSIIRCGLYKDYALGNLVRVALSMVLPLLAYHFIDESYLLLLGSYALASAVTSLFYVKILRARYSATPLRKRFLRWLFVRYKSNFTFGVFHGILNAVAHNLPVILFYYFFDSKYVAAFVVLDRTVRSGVSVINNSIRTVVASTDIALNRARLKTIQFLLFGIGVLGTAVGLGVQFFFGDLALGEWAEVPAIIPYVAIWALGMISNPIGSALIMKYEDFYLLTVVQAIDVIARVLLIILSALLFKSFYFALCSYVICSLAYNGFVTMRGWLLLNKNERNC